MPKLHHIGWVVKNIEKARASLGAFMGQDIRADDTVIDQERLIKICFVETAGGAIELIEPLTPESPVSELLKKEGPMLYHICLEVEDIDEEVKRLTAGGKLLVHPQKPAPAIGGRRVAFIYDRNIGLVELVEA